MKQKIYQILPIEFGIDLKEVESIELIFKQDDEHQWSCVYPSEQAFQYKDKNVVCVDFTPQIVNRFLPGIDTPVYLDTRIHLIGSTYNPETMITSFILKKSLFESE